MMLSCCVTKFFNSLFIVYLTTYSTGRIYIPNKGLFKAHFMVSNGKSKGGRKQTPPKIYFYLCNRRGFQIIFVIVKWSLFNIQFCYLVLYSCQVSSANDILSIVNMVYKDFRENRVLEYRVIQFLALTGGLLVSIDIQKKQIGVNSDDFFVFQFKRLLS